MPLKCLISFTDFHLNQVETKAITGIKVPKGQTLNLVVIRQRTKLLNHLYGKLCAHGRLYNSVCLNPQAAHPQAISFIQDHRVGEINTKELELRVVFSGWVEGVAIVIVHPKVE